MHQLTYIHFVMVLCDLKIAALSNQHIQDNEHFEWMPKDARLFQDKDGRKL